MVQKEMCPWMNWNYLAGSTFYLAYVIKAFYFADWKVLEMKEGVIDPVRADEFVMEGQWEEMVLSIVLYIFQQFTEGLTKWTSEGIKYIAHFNSSGLSASSYLQT